MKRLLCWIGWHGPTDDVEHVFYSNRTMTKICRCAWCKQRLFVDYGL